MNPSQPHGISQQMVDMLVTALQQVAALELQQAAADKLKNQGGYSRTDVKAKR